MKMSEIIKEIVRCLVEKKEAEFRYDRMLIDVSVQYVSHSLWQGKVSMVRIDLDATLTLAESQNRYIITVSPEAIVPDVVKILNGILKELAKYLGTKIEVKNYIDLDGEWIVETPNATYVIHGLPWVRQPHVIYENEKVTIAYYNVSRFVELTDEDVEKFRMVASLRDELYDLMEELEIKKIDLGKQRKEVVSAIDLLFKLTFMIFPKEKKAFIEPTMSGDDLKKLLDTALVLARQQLDKVKKLYLKHILTS